MKNTQPIALSQLGFGCASVMGKVGSTASLNAMACAVDHGITHFDIARSYGFGRAEKLLGSFIKGKRSKLTITSKFGVIPPELSIKTKLLMPIARAASKTIPGLATIMRKRSGQMLARNRFDAAYAKQCLNRSLAELKTDYLDLY
jgi:aryl-alcohol dehydrogenase-like predicted oxidoreductase